MTDSDPAESRQQALTRWFQVTVQGAAPEAGGRAPTLSPVSGDASFRRYFRAWHAGVPYILVDAPPDKEGCEPFVTIARRFGAAGVNVPAVHAVDQAKGFMCLSDFGDTLLWGPLERARREPGAKPGADGLYAQAFDQLLRIQAIPLDAGFTLPAFDHALLLREMALFRDWYCQGLLGMTLAAREAKLLEQVFAFLIDAALAQPRVCAHRDYHSRNLLLDAAGPLGVIDFQDAVGGPFSYDLVSLLKDCYIAWPRERVNAWALDYLERAVSEHIVPQPGRERFLRDFDLMGMQRHLKAIGIFARLHSRDGKSGYLCDIPRTLDYVRVVAPEHEALRSFAGWLEEILLPAQRRVLAPLLEQGRTA